MGMKLQKIDFFNFSICLVVASLFVFGSAGAADESFQSVVQTSHNLSLSPLVDPCGVCHTGFGDDQRSKKINSPIWIKNKALENLPFIPKEQSFSGQNLKRPLGSSHRCLSCHDGVVAMDAHIMGLRTEGASDFNKFLDGFFEPLGGPGDRSFRFLDHPVSISYPRKPSGQFKGNNITPRLHRYWSIPDLSDDQITLPTGPQSSYLYLPTEGSAFSRSLLVRTTRGLVECDSCHNPHNNEKAAFLRESGHSLCLICHDR